MTIYLVRHGESECNVKGMLYGRTDCALTELGRRQAAAVAEKLRGEHIERCVASPLIRASDTAGAAASALGLELEYDERLMEQDMGEWENVPFEDLVREQPKLLDEMFQDWTSVVPPGGESYETLRERVRGVLRGIIERDEDTLIVAHNGPLTTAMILLLDMPDTSVNNLWFEQGTWSCVEIERGRARLKYFNK